MGFGNLAGGLRETGRERERVSMCWQGDGNLRCSTPEQVLAAKGHGAATARGWEQVQEKKP